MVKKLRKLYVTVRVWQIRRRLRSYPDDFMFTDYPYVRFSEKDLSLLLENLGADSLKELFSGTPSP